MIDVAPLGGHFTEKPIHGVLNTLDFSGKDFSGSACTTTQVVGKKGRQD